MPADFGGMLPHFPRLQSGSHTASLQVFLSAVSFRNWVGVAVAHGALVGKAGLIGNPKSL
ncbi:hypothetical protein GCM10011408_09880 [Dyella caseinilytica]|nr:hypothetical protein GCM10011408_09880 [Dyella caseinilytica]